ncbi:unnamed protein product [Lampetra planeri]
MQNGRRAVRRSHPALKISVEEEDLVNLIINTASFPTVRARRWSCKAIAFSRCSRGKEFRGKTALRR